ncbi:PREDICTED: methyl-CpG-binding domain protein 6 [Charadrius vociferus]|uniref:methyl-CpG-binding domain protein 6 n=1 Tax=Charadrius vociferus TaxID=50402 RepID=UPI000521AE6C|nr:PREDICTED: methyl-CpG-binding domain protein 6 [Charadrius vociferus]
MSSGNDGTGTDRPTSPPLAGPVPVGWERKVEEGSVCYISPSGTALTSLEQTCAYLLAEGTCKCGLECPLNMHKVFNFDPGAAVAGRGAPGAQGQQDMTKLCNHRQKTAAMATLCHSMEGTLGPCHPGTGPGLSLLFSAEGHLAVAPHTGTHLPSTVGSFPMVPLGTKILDAPSALTGTWLTTPPFLQPHDIVPGTNGIPESFPASPCFGLPLPLPDVANPPQSPVAQSQRPKGRTSTWPALLQGATRESPGLGVPGLSLPATTGAPQTDKVNSVSDALTSQSSNNPPVPLDAVPEGRGFLGLPPVSTPFPASSLLSLAAKAQLGNPDPTPALSTLPPCPLSPGMLLSLTGERAPGRGSQWLPDLQDPVAHRAPPERKGMPPSVTGQPLAALLSLLGAWGCPREGGPGVSSLPLGPLPATNSSPGPGTGLLPTSRDFSGQLRGLFRQLAPSSEPTSGTFLRSKASSPNSSPGTLLSTLLPLPPGSGERSPKACPVLPDRPPLFSVLPALLTLHPALLAAGLGPPEPAPTASLSSLASPSVAPTSTDALPTTAEPLCEEGRAPDSPTGTPEALNLLGSHLGSSLLSATLLGNLPVLSPLLQNQPLLFPLGLSLCSDQDTASPLAGLLQSLQLCPRFGSLEKSATLLGPSAGGSPNPSAPPGPLEVTPSALEPPVPCLAEPGSPRPNEGARVCPTSHSPLKRGRWRAEGLNRETPSLSGPPSTKSPRRGAGRRGLGTQRHFNGQVDDRGGKGLPATAPPAPPATWRCIGDILAAEQQLRVEEIKVDLAVARCPWAGRPVKSRRRKLLT